MLIGVPKEIKPDEYRVGLTPESVLTLVNGGHQVMVLTNAGVGIGKDDQDYLKAGAEIVATRDEIFERAEMVIKVKEPQLDECALLRQGQILFTYLHLAPDPEQTNALVNSGVSAIAYESVVAEDKSYPLLIPMSAIAGRMAVQAGASCLEKAKGGSGILMGGVTNVDPAKVTIIGGGVVGYNAIEIALGMQANVTVLDKSAARLDYLETVFGDDLNAVNRLLILNQTRLSLQSRRFSNRCCLGTWGICTKDYIQKFVEKDETRISICRCCHRPAGVN